MVNHFVKESWQGWLELGVMSRRYAYATRVGLGRCIGFLGVGLAVLASSLAVHAADVSVTVTVKDSAGTALNGARVAAMRFTSSGPSGTDSVTGITNPNGQVTLTLSDSKEYQIVAAATGYLPNLRDQMMGFGGESLITPSSGLTKTITLRQESGLANIDIVVQAAKGGDAKRILCDYKMESVPEPAAFGVGPVAAGSGNEQITVTIYNLKKNTIQGSVNCFDPDLNRHAFTRLTSAQLTSLAALADGGTLTISGPLDLSVTTAFAPPPVEQDDRLRVEGGISGSSNLRVLLKDSDGNPLDQNAEVRVKDTLTGSFTSNNVGRRVIEVYRLSGTGLKYIDVNVFGYGGANNQSVGAVDTNWSTLTSPVQVAVTITQATGSIPFALQVNGADIFGGVSIEPDYRGRGYWSQIAGHPCATLNPGSTVNHTQTEDGRGTITRVPDGLYEVAGFSAFGGGRKSANYANNGQPGSTSDLCIAVTSGTLKVYNKAGTDLNLSRVTISLDIQSGTNGTIKGKVNFPRLVTLPSDGDGKCNCIAFPSFQTTSSSAAPQAGVVALAGTSTRSIDFTLPVKAGTSYHLDMKCSKFGAINRGSERRADLTNTTQITGVVFEMVPSGALKFVLRKPDGTSYKAQMSPEPGQDFRSFAFHSCFVNVHGPAGFGSAQCSQTTNEVTITGLPPGSYEGNIEGNGEFAYAIPPLGDLLVVEGTTTINTVTFKTGVPVLPVITGTQLPVPTFEPGSAPTEVHLVCFPHGEALGPTTLEGLVGFKRSAPFLTEYRRDFGPFAGSSPIWKVKRATPGLWDCSVVVRKHFGGAPAGGDSTPQKEYTLVVGRALKVAVDSAKATTQIDDPQSPPDPITGARRKINVQPLPITVNTEETAKLAVNIKAARFFDANAMGEIQGDGFSKMFNFIPKCVAARAKDGALLGIGVAVPIFTSGTPDLFGKMEEAVRSGDAPSLNTHMSSVTMRCSIDGLPAGEALVMATALLYPTVVKAVTFTSNTTTALDVDFEAEVGTQIGAIQGTVTDKATGTGISNVTVKTQHRAIPEKKAITGSDGSYAFIGLPFGRYGIHVDVAGYEVASNVAIIKTTATTTVSFALRAAPGSVTGTVLKSRFPFRQGLPEQKCLCWNETLNTQTDNPPAIQTSHTDELGTYTFKRLVASDKYRVVCIAEGKGVMNQTITATSGAQTAADMVVQFKPPELRVNHRIDPITGKLELLFQSPKPVASLPTARYTTGTSFNTSASATSVTLTSAPVPNTWTASIDKPSEAITLRVTATDGFKTSDTDHSIGAAAKASNVVKHAEEKAIEGSSFYPDESEKDSACTFPAGVVTFSSSTTPTVTLTRASSSTVTAALPSGTSYASQDSLVTVTATALELASGKKLLVSLPCDPKLGNPQSFQLFQLIAGTWTKVEATLSYSPTDRNCEGEIKSISNAALAASLDTPTGNVKLAKQLGLSAVQNGEFVYTGAQTTASGTFSILSSAQSGSTQGSAYTGASLNAYNFPNPFNMTTKTLSLTSGGSTSSLSTSGTIIRYDLPSANGGRVLVRIYTLAGELVRVIDEGDKTGGFTYYTTWDGKNKDGENVASGVYFAVFDVPGQKPKDHTIKMAVLK